MLEERIINFWKNHAPAVGDDAAILPACPEQRVVSKDLLIEGVHFDLEWTHAQDLSYKALMVNLSDCAAMGAEPEGVLLGLSFPANKKDFALQFIKYFARTCKEASVEVFGGDTTRSPGPFIISLCVLGKTLKPTLRKGAIAGCRLMVAGHLGWAHMGWKALETKTKGFSLFKKAFLRPKARLAEGQWLRDQQGICAMMDLSDGLKTDLPRFAKASHLGATLSFSFQDKKFNSAAKKLNLDAHEVMIIGGEDYSLLCAIDPVFHQPLSRAFQKRFNYTLKDIGVLTARRTISWGRSFQNPTFSHF